MFIRFSMVVMALAACGLPTVVGPSSTAVPQPLMWVIDGAQPGYLLGTVHLGEPRILALPPTVRSALNDADRVYVEARESVISAPQTQRLTVDRSGLPLSQRIPASLYQRIAATLTATPNIVVGLHDPLQQEAYKVFDISATPSANEASAIGKEVILQDAGGGDIAYGLIAAPASLTAATPVNLYYTFCRLLRPLL